MGGSSASHEFHDAKEGTNLISCQPRIYRAYLISFALSFSAYLPVYAVFRTSKCRIKEWKVQNHHRLCREGGFIVTQSVNMRNQRIFCQKKENTNRVNTAWTAFSYIALNFFDVEEDFIYGEIGEMLQIYKTFDLFISKQSSLHEKQKRRREKWWEKKKQQQPIFTARLADLRPKTLCRKCNQNQQWFVSDFVLV